MKVSDLQIQQNTHQIRPDNINQNRIDKRSNVDVDNQAKPNFNELLNNRIKSDNSIQFSSHAAQRIDQRNLELTPDHISRLEDGLGRVKEKGSKSSLLMMDDMAYVVSVKNQTVITALNEEAARSNVFTNIDSVAIV